MQKWTIGYSDKTKPKQTQFKANQTQFERPISVAFGSHTNISYILSNELWRFLSCISKLGGES